MLVPFWTWTPSTLKNYIMTSSKQESGMIDPPKKNEKKEGQNLKIPGLVTKSRGPCGYAWSRCVYSGIANCFYAENLNISRLERLIQPLHMWQKRLTWCPDSGIEPACLFTVSVFFRIRAISATHYSQPGTHLGVCRRFRQFEFPSGSESTTLLRDGKNFCDEMSYLNITENRWIPSL